MGNKIKLIFKSKATRSTTTVEDLRTDKDEINTIKNVSANTGITKFPTANIEVIATSKHPSLLSIKSGDEVSVFMAEHDKPYNKFHKGILLSVTIKSAKDNFEIIHQSVSAFYLLQKRNLYSASFTNKKGLREIIAEVLEMCEINDKVIIDKKIINDFKLTPFKNFPALSFINAICYKLDLVYDFGNGDIMKISKRKDILHNIQTSIPILLNNTNIISSEFEQ